MTVGEKIKYIRTFRGMTQQQLGVAIGLPAKGADNRMAQYETNYRVPKKDMLKDIAEALDVSPLNFISPVSGSAEDIMQTFFWLDEDNPEALHFFPMVPSKKKYGTGNAIKASNNSGIIGVGFDKSDAIMNLIGDGHLLCTMAQNPDVMGSMGVEACVKALEGESLGGKVTDTGVSVLTK